MNESNFSLALAEAALTFAAQDLEAAGRMLDAAVAADARGRDLAARAARRYAGLRMDSARGKLAHAVNLLLLEVE